MLFLSIQIADGVIDSLPVNFFVNNLLSVLALHGDGNAGNIECDSCDSGDPPVSRCTTCSHFLCEFCTQGHRRGRQTKTHHLISLEEVKKSGPSAISRPQLCKEHQGEILKLYCQSCEEVICRDCTIVKHRDHKYTFTKDAYLKSKEEVLKSLEDLKTQLPILEQALEAVSRMAASVQSHAKKTEECVDNYFEKLFQTLEIRCAELIEDIRNIKKAKMNCLRSQQEELELAIGKVKSTVEFTETALGTDSHVEVLSIKKQMVSRLEALNSTKWCLKPQADGIFTFKADNKLQEAITSFGVISDIATCAGASSITMGHASEGVVYNVLHGQPVEFTIIARDNKNRERSEGGDSFIAQLCCDHQVEHQKASDQPVLHVRDIVVNDCGDGKYTFNVCENICNMEGPYNLSVSLNGIHIQGSPFAWNSERWTLLQMHPSWCIELLKDGLEARFCKVMPQVPQSYHSYGVPKHTTATITQTHLYSNVGVRASQGQYYCSALFGSLGFSSGKHSWRVQISSNNRGLLSFGVVEAALRQTGNFTIGQGNQWIWTSQVRYQPSGSVDSTMTVFRGSNAIEMYLDCDNNKLIIYNQTTRQSDTWEGILGEVFPVFVLNNFGDVVSLCV